MCLLLIGYKHVRLYDTRMPSRQPSASIDISDEFRVTAIRPSLDGSEVFVGDTSGGTFHELPSVLCSHGLFLIVKD